MGEFQAEQRQSPELAALLQAVREQGVQHVGDTLQLAAALPDMRMQSPAVELQHQPWHAVDVESATDAAGHDVLRISLDVMLVHQMLPLAAGLSPHRKQEAQARILRVVSYGSGATALGADAAAEARTMQNIQVSEGPYPVSESDLVSSSLQISALMMPMPARPAFAVWAGSGMRQRRRRLLH